MRNILLLSIGGAVVVGGVALFMLFGTEPVPSQTTENNEVAESEAEVETVSAPFSGTDTMQALLARGENLECTISYQVNGGTDITTEGSYFTSRGRMRGDFIVNSQGIEAVSSIILANDMMYSWTDVAGQRYGMKMSTAEFETAQTDETVPDAQEAVPMDAQVSYECKPWVAVDGSIFEPPTDIVFTEYSSAMNAGMEFGTVYEGGVEMGAEQCAMCDELDGAAAAQCRAMLSCE